MEIEIYLDSLFFMNLMINLWILQLLKRRFSLEAKGIRLFGAAVLGAGIYILAFFVPLKSVLLQPVAVVISVPLMIGMILTKRKRRHFKSMIGMGLVYSFIFAGILRVVFNKWRVFAGKEVTLWAVLAGVYFCTRIGMWCLKRAGQIGRKSLYQVCIKSAGKETGLTALLDTGNSLIEPISKKPVCLIEEELLAHITLENPLFLRAIPYRSVGCVQGTLYGVEIPELRIREEERLILLNNVICAAAPHKLSTKNAYQMILHPALFAEENIVKEKER